MRRSSRITLIALLLAPGGLLINHAAARERQFLVLLAHSPKQFPGTGMPPGGLPSSEWVRRQYFDLIDPQVDSFAEYWEEISYGDVSISGEVTDWIMLPWPIQPHADGDDVNSPARFFDLDGDGAYTYGKGERLRSLKAVIIDLDGDPNGMNNGPFAAAPASGHVTNEGYPVWKPGERFVDVDSDGKWDGLDEATNLMDHNGDRIVDLPGPWIDLNGDGDAYPGGPTFPDISNNRTFLPDSDNDGNPDCCPDGPGGAPGMGCGRFNIEVTLDQYDANPLSVCPPLLWDVPNGEFTDCNGNLVPDVCDISPADNPDAAFECAKLGWTGPFPVTWSRDRNPVDSDGSPNPDGIPDECQFEPPGNVSACSDEPPAPCAALTGSHIRQMAVRCEFCDINHDGFSIVEPFENFMRRWDPCVHDPDASPENLDANEARTHWVKVYDPSSNSSATCDEPPRTVVYSDPSYILDNYPARDADVQELINEASEHWVFGSHDPLQLITPAIGCVCADGCRCGGLGADCMAATYGEDILDDLPMELPRFCVVGRHAVYDPPDGWFNTIAATAPTPEQAYSTKMQRTAGFEPGMEGSIPNERTPEPAWYQQAWGDRYRRNNPDFDPNAPVGPDNPTTLPCDAPPWPDGDANIPHVVAFTDANEPTYDPTVNRRYFKANRGGIHGDGTGWMGCDWAMDSSVIFETGHVSPGFETYCNHRILPDEFGGVSHAGTFYDGWVEHDDLPSSKYHLAGDQRLGEVTSPYNDEIWGHDRGIHQLAAAPTGPDGIVPAAGPYARNIQGNFGFDAGNLLTMEYLSWRTASPFTDGKAWERHGMDTGPPQQWRAHPYAGPSGANLGFRDYNLDGLIDLGESRFAESENYVADSNAATPNDGRASNYPFNSRRLMEDCIEVVDVLIDFDDWVDDVSLEARSCVAGPPEATLPASYQGRGDPDTIAAAGLNSGIVLLSPGSHAPREFRSATGFYPIHNEDTTTPATSFPVDAENVGETLDWSIFFHDLVRAIDVDFIDEVIPADNFQTAFAAHHYLHLWQGFPDMYDYDVFIDQPGAVINTPVGRWDVMARGGLVHPAPALKESACTEWIAPTDLTHVAAPGVDVSITIPPYELTRDNAAFYLDHADSGEGFFLWSAGSGFGHTLPGDGLLIMHKRGAQPPAPSRDFPFPYVIEQADGLHELEAGIAPFGDAGDPWPGTTGNTAFGCETNPASRWYDNTCSGLNVFDVVPDASGGTHVSLNWIPTDIPSMRFLPPSGQSIGTPPETLYQVRTVANDAFSGTWLRFFYSTDPADTSIDPDGANYIGAIRKPAPGQMTMAVEWNVAGLPDGRYWLFADVVPDEGPDGADESATTPRAGHANAGDDVLIVDHVDTSAVVAHGTSAFLTDPVSVIALDESNTQIDFTALGVEPGHVFMIEGFTIRSPALRTIIAVSTDGHTLTLSAPTDGTLPPGGGQWLIVAPGTSRQDTWIAARNDQAAEHWEVKSVLGYPDGAGGATTGAPFESPGGEIGFTIHGGTRSSAVGDHLTFTTTGLTAPSHPVRIVDGTITEVIGDFNHDAVTDLTDYAAFWECLESSGPGQELPPGACTSAFDVDGDMDVDVKDFRMFLDAFNLGR